MPLEKPQPRRATVKAFRTGLDQLIQLKRAPSNLPKESDPQRIYSLSLRAIINGKGLKAAKPVVWEFMLGGGGKPAVIVSVGDPPGKAPPRVTSLTRDPEAAEAVRLTRRIGKLSQVRHHRFELRHLRISPLSMGAYWLKSLESGQPDLAVPYRAIPKKMEAMRAYPMDRFLAVLRPIAVKYMAAAQALRRKSKAA